MASVVHVLMNGLVPLICAKHEATWTWIRLHDVPGLGLGNGLIAVLHHFTAVCIADKVKVLGVHGGYGKYGYG